MFLVMLYHRAVAHEWVVAARTHAVEVPTHMVVVAVRPATVNAPIEELKPFENVHETVEVSSVQIQHVAPVRSEVAPLAQAVVVLPPGNKHALAVGTQVVSVEPLESTADHPTSLGVDL